MAAFLEPITCIVRAGPEARAFGDRYRSVCFITVQHNRTVYMHALASEALNYRDAADMVRAVRQEARRWGWTDILWKRIRSDGSVHVARVKLNGVI